MLTLTRWYLNVYAWLAVLVVALLDHITGNEIGFFVFYFLPVGLGTWAGGRRMGLALALTCAVVWLIVDATTGTLYAVLWYRYWNTFIRYIAFVILALLIARMKGLMEQQEKALSGSLTHALAEVRELRGLLPICAACKKIRNDQGYWEHIEVYIAAHSQTEFTHSICPECTQRLYTDLFQPPSQPPLIRTGHPVGQCRMSWRSSTKETHMLPKDSAAEVCIQCL